MNSSDSIVPRPTPEIDDDVHHAGELEVASAGMPDAYDAAIARITAADVAETFDPSDHSAAIANCPAPTTDEQREALHQLATDPGLAAVASSLFPETPADALAANGLKPLPYPRVRPLGSRVLVKPDDAPEAYDAAGLIQRTDQARERPQEGTIVRTGLALKAIDEAKLQHVCIGQRVMYGMYSGSDVYVDDVGFIMLDVEDLLGIVEGEGPATVRKTWEKPAEPSRIIGVERDTRIIIP